jgi:hypothetical protein
MLHSVGRANVQWLHGCAADVLQGVVRAGMMTLPSRESFMASIGKFPNRVAPSSSTLPGSNFRSVKHCTCTLRACDTAELTSLGVRHRVVCTKYYVPL